jgi:hypothetical protein
MAKGFQIGNAGKPVGVLNKRSKEWFALRDSIVGSHGPMFNRLLSDLWDDPDVDNRIKAAMLYLQALNYFKPKLANVDHTIFDDTEQKRIVIEIIERSNPDPNGNGDTSISPDSIEQ